MNTAELDFRALLSILRNRWRTVVLTTLALAALVALFSQTADKEYEAAAEVLINQPDPADRVATTNGRDAAPRVVENEIRFIEGNAVADLVEAQFGEGTTVQAKPADLEEAADLITIEVTAATPERAQTAALAAAELYIETRADETRADFEDVAAEYSVLIAEIDEQLGGLLTDEARTRLLDRVDALTSLRDEMTTAAALATGDVTLVNRPELPTDPSSPKTARNVALAVIAGLFLGLGLAILFAMLDQRARNSASVALAMPGIDVLAEIPQRPRRGLRASTIGTIEEPATSRLIGDSIRTLRAHIKRDMQTSGAVTTLVLSPRPGDGKTAVAANLAIAIARSGTRTVFVDAHAADPAVHEIFGLRNTVGLADILEDTSALRDAAASPVDGIPLRVITSGALAEKADLLASDIAGSLFSGLVELFPDAAIIIDGPPALHGSAALDLVRIVDTSIIVVDAATSSTADLEHTAARIEQIGGRVTGTVLNRVHRTRDHWSSPVTASSGAAPVLATGAPVAAISDSAIGDESLVSDLGDHDQPPTNAWPFVSSSESTEEGSLEDVPQVTESTS